MLIAYGKSGCRIRPAPADCVTGSTARAAQLVTLTAATIRGVGIGVVGVALIQALLLGVGFFVVGLRSPAL